MRPIFIGLHHLFTNGEVGITTANRRLKWLCETCGIPYPLGKHEAARLYDKYIREKMGQMADELLDYDQETKLAPLKANVRKLCFGLLGPAPEDEDWYYRNPDGTPSERPKKPKPAKPPPTSDADKPEEIWSPNVPVEKA